MTQLQLARAARVAINTIGRVETRGVRDRRVYLKMRRALGISEQDIQAYIDARPVDARLRPLIEWFDALSVSEQELIGQLLLSLLSHGSTTHG